MPRPRKCRKVCCLPKTLEFVPVNACHEKEPIYMTVDEYETVRLIDKEGFSQEECGLKPFPAFISIVFLDSILLFSSYTTSIE